MIVGGAYDPSLVIVSAIVAVLASYTALDLAGRVRAAAGADRRAWLLAAALAMGGGIWSMHFIGMLAFELPMMPIAYDVLITVLSLLIAIVITGIAFTVVVGGGGALRWSRLAASGTFMGVGIVAMHYIGMAAMEMPAHLSYDPWLVALSLAIAVSAATFALRLALMTTSLAQQWAGAGVMGAAIAGMHYCGMAAARFAPMPGMAFETATGAHADRLALAIAGATFVILILALAASAYDRRIAVLAAREAEVLRASETQFRAFYNRTPTPLQSLDGAGRILFVNDYWSELLGYPRAEAVGRPFAEFLTPPAAERFLAIWPEVVAGNEQRQFEVLCRRRSGEVVDVLISARTERDEAGGIVRILAVLTDITARKRLEEQLIHAQKMEAVGQLTGGIAHDFNNLLTVVGGNLALLEPRLQHDPELQRLARAAGRAVERGERLTQQLLAFSRRQWLQPETFDLNELVAGISEILRATLGAPILVELRPTADLGRCFADPAQVEAAIINLAINARDAMPGGGKLTIATERRQLAAGEVKELAAGSYLVIEVRDTGHGMPPEVLERALEPFFTTKEIGKGSGLGLSMVYGFATQSGGGLEVESAVGAGTTVRMFLPETAPSEDETPAAPPGAATAALARATST